MIENYNFLVVGTVSNVGSSLEREIKRINKILKLSKDFDFYLVESDSFDNTLNILKSLKDNLKNFNYVSKGILRDKFPNRIDRIRYCRNSYVEYIRMHYPIQNWDYILVMDLDGACRNISRKSIESCFKTSISWDACFANQLFGYYDLYALREQNWMPDDCFAILEKQKSGLDSKSLSKRNWLSRFFIYDRIRYQVLYSKMRRIPVTHNWIKVDSAFGGAAIYKANLFTVADYTSKKTSITNVCEHVDLHTNAAKLGFSELYINPRFINLYFNHHILNQIKLIRFVRELKKFFTSGGGGGI